MTKILIIEDEKTLRDEIVDILHFESFEVIQADNGKDGLDLALDQKPDLILCDIMMPLMNGTEVLKKLMLSEKSRHIPFIFITALSERGDIRSGMESGADDYLIKPFSVTELLGSIKSRLEKANNRQTIIQTSVSAVKKNMSKRVMHLNDKIVEQTNDLDLLRLDKLIHEKDDPNKGTIVETFQNIVTSNMFHNIDNMVNNELRNKISNTNNEKFFINMQNEIRRQSPLINNWSVFQLKFNQLYPHYFEKLVSRFPDLKQSEIALASAIEMNLSTTQIASLLNITAASVRKNKYRLKKKLKLPKEDVLEEFLHSLILLEPILPTDTNLLIT